jgi:vacuolar-type H+-ATPase subunit I/STV1
VEIFGYIGYAALLALAAIWTLGVRIKLALAAHTVLGALFFVVGAIALGLSGADKLHAFWIIAAGYIVAIVMGFLAAHVPWLFRPFRLLASVFAAVARVGIPTERVQAAQIADLKATIDEWASRTEETKK